MAAIMYRQWSGQVHIVGSAVIEDRGHLRGACTASSGDYLFSEAGAGIPPLILIGTKPDVVNFLINRKAKAIDNRIECLPEIYMAIGRYVPGARYRGLFPVQATIQALTERAADFVPGSTLTDLVGAVATIKDTVGVVRGGMMSKVYSSPIRDPKEGKWTGEWYLKFHYLQDRDTKMTLVAKKRLSFGMILELLKNEWGV